MSVTSAVKRNASATRWKRSKPLSAEADRLRDKGTYQDRHKGTEGQRDRAEGFFFFVPLHLCAGLQDPEPSFDENKPLCLLTSSGGASLLSSTDGIRPFRK